MNYKKTVQHTVWSEPDEQRRVRRLGTKTNGEVFEDLKQKLETAGFMPDDYFIMSGELRPDDKIPDFDEAVCSVNFGSEGIYLDIDLKYLSPEKERRQVHFATGKTLGENTFDELQATFNNDVNRSNSEVYNLLQAVNPDALNKFLENENDEELEV